MEIIHFFDGGFGDKIQSELSEKEGKLFIVLLEYKEDGNHRSDLAGLDIALKLETDVPLIICSFLPETYFLTDKKLEVKFRGLLARKMTAFVQLPDIYNPEEWYTKYLEILSSEKEEDVIALELQKDELLNETMSRIRHDYGRSFDDGSEESKSKTLLAIEKAKEVGLTGSDEEIIEQIKSFKVKPKNSLFAGRYFPGIFCDIEGTLFFGYQLNTSLVKTLEEAAKTKPVTLWTGGDLKSIQEKLWKHNITWKLLSKYDFAGAEVEIAYDDDSAETILGKYGIKIRECRSPIGENVELARKIKILHQLLTPDGAKEVLTDETHDDILNIQYGDTDIREGVERLITIGDPLDDQYVEELRKIRDFLLKE